MALLRIVKRDVGSQFAISRNLREGYWAKCKRCFWGVVYLFRGLKVAVSSMRTVQLGSRVVYQGRQCFVSNWANCEQMTLADGKDWYQEYCDRAEIQPVISVRELYHRFSTGFGWYMSSWYGIDIQSKVNP